MENYLNTLRRGLVFFILNFIVLTGLAKNLYYKGNAIVPKDSCLGSVGDPIVNIIFGSGGSEFGPPLNTGITNLNYVTNQCPVDGQYTITHHTQNCFNGNWHEINDHTGNPNGYFMLINASFTPNDFYVQTINSLCDGTSYEFSSYILNMIVNNGILPNITFSIEKTDGTVLQSYDSGDIPITNPATWEKYGFNFTLPIGITSVVIRMKNNAPGGAGNDLALDDITFRAIGPLITNQIIGFSSDSLIICQGKLSSLDLKSSIETCYLSSDLQWQNSHDLGKSWYDIPDSTNSHFTIKLNDTGTYVYRIAATQKGNINNHFCRVVSKNVFIRVLPVPQPTLFINSSSEILCSGNDAIYQAHSTFQGNKPIFKWSLNGNPAGINDSIYTNQNPKDGDLVECILVSDLPCTFPVNSQNQIKISVFSSPIIQLPANYLVDLGKSIRLNPLITGNIANYSWTPTQNLSDPNSPNPVANTLYNTIYKLKIISMDGCTDSAFTKVTVINDLDIPNIFSPNGDGINDIWNMEHLVDFPACTVDIYNRYGSLVFHSEGYGKPWDGTFNGNRLPRATYYYIINLHNGYHLFTGSITLIR